MSMKNIQSLSVCLCMYIYNKRWMNYFVSNFQGAVKKNYLIVNDHFSFFSHRVEICHNATLKIDISCDISAVLTILEKQNIIFFNVKTNCRHN